MYSLDRPKRYTARYHRIRRTGWLLSSMAPENIAKGKTALATLGNDREREEAEDCARALVKLYTTDGSVAAREAYIGHQYV